MLKKAKAEAEAQAGGPSGDGGDFAQGIRDSSRQIWLAGLGAFARAQAEGMKMFEALVEQGQSLESRTRRAASETATAAAGMAAQKAKEMQAMAGGTWDKLEQVFEQRVARALSKLGVHTQADVDRLSQRVEALSEAVNELIKSGNRGGAAVAKKTAGRSRKRAPKRPATAGGAPAARRSARKTSSG
jgi:poly(hydroxyalkanoate) granule-associated protein